MNLKEFSNIFNPVLEKMLEKKLMASYQIIKSSKLQKILNYTKKFILWWWKRIRPYLIFTIYKAFGGKNNEHILRLSTWFELWHAFALIHDDIMDQWDTRRNIKTYHKYIQSIIKNIKSQHYWISQAMLIWDLIFSWANEIIFDIYDLDQKLLEKIRWEYLEMSRQTIFWQIIDVSLTISQSVNKSALDKKNFLKTSNYTFIKPMMVWAILWGAQTVELQKLQKFWKYLWNAFQIRDDLKDIMENSQKSWKTYFSDIKEWQHTLMTYYIFKNWNPQQRFFLQDRIWKDLSSKDIKQLKQIFEDSGAINYAFQEINKNLLQAEKFLDNIKFWDNSYKNDFFDIIKLIWE